MRNFKQGVAPPNSTTLPGHRDFMQSPMRARCCGLPLLGKWQIPMMLASSDTIPEEEGFEGGDLLYWTALDENSEFEELFPFGPNLATPNRLIWISGTYYDFAPVGGRFFNSGVSFRIQSTVPVYDGDYSSFFYPLTADETDPTAPGWIIPQLVSYDGTQTVDVPYGYRSAFGVNSYSLFGRHTSFFPSILVKPATADQWISLMGASPGEGRIDINDSTFGFMVFQSPPPPPPLPY